MDNSLHATSSDDMYFMTFCNEADENEHARIEGTAEPENPIDTDNWDDIDLNNVNNNVDPFSINGNNELDYPNVEQLSVQPFSQGSDEEIITNSEACTDAESVNLQSRGILKFTFKIENVSAFCSRQNAQVTSDSFKCRDLPFSLIVQYKGSGISAFLKRDSTGNQDQDTYLDICVACDISVVDQVNETMRTKGFLSHTYQAGTDYGFTNIINNYDIKNGGFVHNDSLIFNVYVKGDPPSINSNYSKAVIGCVGIRNQGATCYMNSLLQVLFFITKFRTACYRIPTEMDDNSSIALALQKVFYKLQFSDTAVCTKNLTKSFGWSTVDVLMQHDIQEMMRVLIEKIEGRMKNTLLEPILPSIFQGKFISYVKCRDIEYSSQREEVFYDIQLSIENASNVYDSFKQYVSPEIMDNDNKYYAENFGLQAAEKGTLFINLPPVMFLHLLRFQFDATTNQVVKNNSFYEFYEELDLTDFVREDETTPSKYTLFAVLAHSGGGSHGHYVAYINPTLDGRWFKFDDDTISICQPTDAIDSNFGTLNDADEWTKSMQLNAYMLVYVRNSDAHEILEPVDPMYITKELEMSMRIDPEEEYSNSLKRHHYLCDVNIFLETFLESNYRFDYSQNERTLRMPKFFIRHDISTLDFKKMLQAAFKVSDINRIRMWSIYHSNDCYSYPVFIKEDAQLVQILSDCRHMSLYHFSVWLELAEPECELPSFDPEKDVLVFYYYYSARDCRSYYINHGYHDKGSKVDELVPLLNRLMDWSNQELNIYQEIERTDIRELTMSSHFADYVQQKSGTFVMNVIFEQKEHEQTTKLHSIALHYEDIGYHVELRMCNPDEPKKDVVLTVSLKLSFPELLDRIAKRLNYDHKKIQIFKYYHSYQRRGDPIPSTCTDTLSDILNCAGNQTIYIIYKLHHIDVSEIETKTIFTFQWLPADMKKAEWFTIYISNDDTTESILAAAQKELVSRGLTVGFGKILYIDDNRSKIINDSKEIFKRLEDINRSPYSKRRYFRIDEIPKSDEVLNENEKYILAFLHQPRPAILPFIFKMNWDEPWQSVKNRLRDRMNFSETAWEDYHAVLSTTSCDVDIGDTQCLNEIRNDEINVKCTIHVHYNHSFKRDTKRESNKIEIN